MSLIVLLFDMTYRPRINPERHFEYKMPSFPLGYNLGFHIRTQGWNGFWFQREDILYSHSNPEPKGGRFWTCSTESYIVTLSLYLGNTSRAIALPSLKLVCLTVRKSLLHEYQLERLDGQFIKISVSKSLLGPLL